MNEPLNNRLNLKELQSYQLKHTYSLKLTLYEYWCANNKYFDLKKVFFKLSKDAYSLDMKHPIFRYKEVAPYYHEIVVYDIECYHKHKLYNDDIFKN